MKFGRSCAVESRRPTEKAAGCSSGAPATANRQVGNLLHVQGPLQPSLIAACHYNGSRFAGCRQARKSSTWDRSFTSIPERLHRRRGRSPRRPGSRSGLSAEAIHLRGAGSQSTTIARCCGFQFFNEFRAIDAVAELATARRDGDVLNSGEFSCRQAGLPHAPPLNSRNEAGNRGRSMARYEES
jgi:hypothetical protein